MMKAVVGHDRKPYDRDSSGNPLYIEFDVLECGHQVPMTRTELLKSRHSIASVPPPPRNRNCRKCDPSD